MMKYDTTHLRRQDRAMEEAAARCLLREAAVGVLAMQEPRGGAYAVPLNYAWDGGERIYMHCASEGYKLRCLAACSHVSLVITGAVQVQPQMFSTAYESLVVQGSVEVVEEAAEKQAALHLLLNKYSPDNMQKGRRYAEQAARQTVVLRLSILSWCGKAHRVN